MTETNRRSWEEAVDALRKAAGEVRAAAGRAADPSAEEDAAAGRLKEDVSRLEQSADDLRAKLAAGFEREREHLESSFDRERAQQSTDQVRAALEELAAVAGRLASDAAAAAGKSLKHAEPELRSAVRALEDVAGSTAAWVRTVIDPPAGRHDQSASDERPPLERM